MGKKANSALSFTESNGSIITKPTDIPNYFNYFFIGKISKFRHGMPTTNSEPTHPFITDQNMKDKHCNSEFLKVSGEEVIQLL